MQGQLRRGVEEAAVEVEVEPVAGASFQGAALLGIGVGEAQLGGAPAVLVDALAGDGASGGDGVVVEPSGSARAKGSEADSSEPAWLYSALRGAAYATGAGAVGLAFWWVALFARTGFWFNFCEW
ncbi:hypothetical protein ACIGN6_01850 [Streptomyces sp. NPDC053792]|uniref:hypothetical protein n=1 Tax=Streptomyces sp. NPDC053792 TaxID=3365716 RepID=UPI0037CEA3F1